MNGFMLTTKSVRENSNLDAARPGKHTFHTMEQNKEKWNSIYDDNTVTTVGEQCGWVTVRNDGSFGANMFHRMENDGCVLYAKNKIAFCGRTESLVDIEGKECIHNLVTLPYFGRCHQMLGKAKITPNLILHELKKKEIITEMSYNVDKPRKEAKSVTHGDTCVTPVTNVDQTVIARVWTIFDGL